MTNNNTSAPTMLPSKSDPDVQRLSRLVGTWQISGGTQGQVRYEWMEGGFFLMQHVDLVSSEGPTRGVEIIGRLRPFGEDPSTDIKSRFYGTQGSTFDYVYELNGDILTIWGGQKGSPAYYQGTFSDNDTVLSGRWVYPGGGYESTATRIK